MSSKKRRITYNRVRLSLFLRSYGAHTILNRFKNKPNYRIVSRLSNVLNLDIHLLSKFFSSGIYPKGLPNLNRLIKYLVPKGKMLVYLEVIKKRWEKLTGQRAEKVA